MSEETSKEPIQLEKPTHVVCLESSETSLTLSWQPVERISLNSAYKLDATDYMILCKDILSDSWEECHSASTYCFIHVP